VQYTTVPTTCPYCGCGCELLLEVLDGELAGVLPSKTHTVSRGGLCIKGWTAHEFVTSPKRLREPLIRADGVHSPSSWDEALGLAGAQLLDLRQRFGPNSIACLSSAKCTNEENYLMQKLMRAGLGTNNIDHCARL
jgi:predicted molibdopterin-dependent oxidoreductase YjgC